MYLRFTFAIPKQAREAVYRIAEECEFKGSIIEYEVLPNSDVDNGVFGSYITMEGMVEETEEGFGKIALLYNGLFKNELVDRYPMTQFTLYRYPPGEDGIHMYEIVREEPPEDLEGIVG